MMNVKDIRELTEEQRTWIVGAVFDAAEELNDTVVMQACRRLIEAKRLGCKYGPPSAWRHVLSLYNDPIVFAWVGCHD